jgi:hypothetical protein
MDEMALSVPTDVRRAAEEQAAEAAAVAALVVPATPEEAVSAVGRPVPRANPTTGPA